MKERHFLSVSFIFKHQGDFVMEPKFAVIALWADDVVKVAHFYRDVLRLKHLAHHDGSIHFVVDGTYLVIREGHVTLAEASKSSRFPLFAIAVDDLDERPDNLQDHPRQWQTTERGKT